MSLDVGSSDKPEAGSYSPPASSPATSRHGRECGCTPCRAEDWDAIDAGIAASRPASVPDSSLLNWGAHLIEEQNTDSEPSS